MQSSLFATATVLASVAAAQQCALANPFQLFRRQLDKPVTDPEFYDSKLVPALMDLPSTPHKIEVWLDNSIPASCRRMIEEHEVDGKALTTENVEVISVTYDDCERPWIMCIHPTAEADKDMMADLFGKLPVHLRDYNRLTVAVGGEGSAYADGDNIFIAGEPVQRVSIYGHEVGHGLDAQFFGNGTGFSTTEAWEEAFDADASVVQDYARASQAENFAQMVNVMLYDVNVDGGIGNLAPNWESQFGNTLQLMKDAMGEEVFRIGGTCGERLDEDVNVVKDDSLPAETDSVLTSIPSATPTGPRPTLETFGVPATTTMQSIPSRTPPPSSGAGMIAGNAVAVVIAFGLALSVLV